MNPPTARSGQGEGEARCRAVPLTRGYRGMKYAFNFRDIWAQADAIAEGVGITLVLSLVTIVTGLAIGILGAAARVYGWTWLKAAVATYVEVIRNTPLIVQLFIVFFGLPSLGLRLDAMTAALLALAINLGAYATEIIRAGLEAIPKAQIEAGHSLGLSGFQVFRYIVLGPAVRIVYPALTSQFVLLMLATSIVSQISAPDLFHVASVIQSRTFRDFEIYAVVAVIYLGLALLLKLLFATIGHLAFSRR
jgi:polar amino acid transport system permease protein